MVFDKPLCDNWEVPLYFLHKLWNDFIMGLHINYFDICKFQGVGLGSTQDQEMVRCNSLIGMSIPRHMPNPPSTHKIPFKTTLA